ncbi:MSCRAMM family protein [Enterococcus faecalis]|uniref:MSCRAMM family protein n=2 Tax=Bacteria TaxID=2 RepID=UPI002158629C|nr:SpaA isopeptide-forming pilin-related protein [Enterococcus faecalis]
MNKRLVKAVYIIITLFTAVSQSGLVTAFAETMNDEDQELVKITTDKQQYSTNETIKIDVTGKKENLDQFVLNQQEDIAIQNEKRINDTQKEYTAKISKAGSYSLAGKVLTKAVSGPTITVVDSSEMNNTMSTTDNSTTSSNPNEQQPSDTTVSNESSDAISSSNSVQSTTETAEKQVRSGKYSVTIDGPASIVVGGGITYSVTIASDVTVDDPLNGVKVTVQLPEGFEFHQLADNPYVDSYTYDPATNQVEFVLKEIKDALLHFTFDTISVDDKDKYEDMNVKATVTGNDVGDGVPATDTADTTITGDITYSTIKQYTAVPGTGNRVINYLFNISGSTSGGQFYIWKEKITDNLPAGTEIVTNDGKFGKWEITGSKENGWTAVWTAEKLKHGSDLGSEKDFPSLTVSYPEDAFPSSKEDPKRPPENTSYLKVYDKNGKEYDGGQGHTQGPEMSDSITDGLGIDKRTGTRQGNGVWYDGMFNRHFQIDGSYISTGDKTAREITIEDERDKNNNDDFWNRVNLYQLDLTFNAQMMKVSADYRFEFKTNQHDWQKGAAGNTAKNTKITFLVDGTIGFAKGNVSIALAKGEYITGVRLVIGDKDDATIKILPAAVATMDFSFIPSAQNHETHSDDNDAALYNNHATINGYGDDGSALEEKSDDFTAHFKKNVILGTNVEAPTTMNVGVDSQYTAYINNQSASYDYDNSVMKVVLPAGVYYDQLKGVSPVADQSDAPYNMDIPKPGSGVIISTETVPATSDYPYERQVVVFKFLVPIPAMRAPGAAMDYDVVNKGFGYTIPVNVLADAYTDNRTAAPVSSWATTNDSRFTGVVFNNYDSLLHTDDFNFDTNRDIIAFSQEQSQIQTKGGLILTKLVNNQTTNSNFSATSSAESKDAMNWQLTLQNDLPNDVQNAQIFDRLPQKDANNQFSTTLSGPIENLPTDATVEYSKDATNVSNGNWSADWQGATAFRVAVPVLPKAASIDFNVPFNIPDAIKAGDKVINIATGTGIYAGSEVEYDSNPATVLVETHSVQLTKTDEETKAALAGAVFELQDKDGNVLQKDLTTDKDGHILVENLPSGDYQFVEIKAPVGYELDQTPVTFTLERGQTETVQVGKTNKLILGSVILTKTDDKSGAALAGAIFELQDKDGKVLQSNLTTDADGKLTVDSLKPGDYQLVETQAPEYYELDQTPVTFTIEVGQTEAVKVSMTNKLTPGGVVLTKTDKETGEVLQGAVFELQDKDGKVLQSGLTTDASGKIAVNDLVPGDYQLVETQAPTGYNLNATPVTFTIEKGQTEVVQVGLTNVLSPGVVILTKVDDKSGETLQGAVFELQDKDGKVLQNGLTTGKDGKLMVNPLEPGDYQFVETQAPAGYDLKTTPITFTVEKDQTTAVQVKATNTLTPGGVVLTKVDDKSGEVLQGAVFELQDKDGKALQSGLTTDETGKISVNDLAPGDYQFVETQAPTGYDLDKTPVRFTIEKGQTEVVQVQKADTLTPGGVVLTKVDGKTGEVLQGAVFELQDEKGKPLQSGLTTDETGKIAVNDLAPGNYQFVETQAPTGYNLNATPVKFTVEKGQKEVVQVQLANNMSPNAVILTKTDAATGEILQGAIFELQDKDGHILQNGLTTGKDGKLMVNPLQPGDYQFVETQAPTGYELNKTPIKFTIKKGQTVATQVSMTNKLIVGGVVLTKIDSDTGEKLPGAVFELQDEKGQTMTKNLVTDETGKLAIDNLKPGNYQLVETQAPVGYVLDKTPVKFTIKANQTSSVSVTKGNKQENGSVIFDKIDEKTGAKLAGAEFKLVDSKGKTIIKKLVTSSEGRLAITKLHSGKYQLIETKAPKGYILDATPITFELKNDQTTEQKLKKVNKEKDNTLRVEKRDATTNEVLQGAKFNLLDANGKVIKENLVTDENGSFEVSNIKAGNYQLVETKAPKGYIKDSQPLSVTVKSGSGLTTVTKLNVRDADVQTTKNTPKHEYFPNTGVKNNPLLLWLGMVLLLCVVTFLKYRKNSTRA